MGRPQRFDGDLSKGTDALKDGVSMSSVAMIAGVPLSRVRYQAKILAEKKEWKPIEKKLYMELPRAGAAAGLRRAAAVTLYNLVTTGSAIPVA